MSSSERCESVVGRLRHRIVIETRTLAADGQGGNAETWATHATVWAEIEPRSAGQVAYSEQLQHRISHRVTIRYLSTLASDMRINFGGRYFHIQGFRNLDERKVLTEIDANEGKPS